MPDSKSRPEKLQIPKVHMAEISLSTIKFHEESGFEWYSKLRRNATQIGGLSETGLALLALTRPLVIFKNKSLNKYVILSGVLTYQLWCEHFPLRTKIQAFVVPENCTDEFKKSVMAFDLLASALINSVHDKDKEHLLNMVVNDQNLRDQFDVWTGASSIVEVAKWFGISRSTIYRKGENAEKNKRTKPCLMPTKNQLNLGLDDD